MEEGTRRRIAFYLGVRCYTNYSQITTPTCYTTVPTLAN